MLTPMLYPKNNYDHMTLREDNDPKNNRRLCAQWKEENHIVTLDRPVIRR